MMGFAVTLGMMGFGEDGFWGNGGVRRVGVGK